MKVEKKNKLLQKILMATLAALILFNFITPAVVRADEDEDDEDLGGALFEPIQALVLGLGDSAMGIMQWAFLGEFSVTDREREDFGLEWKWYYGTNPIFYASGQVWDWFFNGYIDIPKFQISPESIFSGNIPAFDINFFNPDGTLKNYKTVDISTIGSFLEALQDGDITFSDTNGETYKAKVLEIIDKYIDDDNKKQELLKNIDDSEKIAKELLSGALPNTYYKNPLEGSTGLGTVKGKDGKTEVDISTVDKFLDALENKNITFSDTNGEKYKEIIMDLLNTYNEINDSEDIPEGMSEEDVLEEQNEDIINSYNEVDIAKMVRTLLNNKKGDGTYGENVSTQKTGFGEVQVIKNTRESIAGQLQSTISYWYNILKNIAIIGLLSVLVYIGIRIVLSSAASDKSKYKEMLKDWAVAMCLLFFMHYFMSFTVTVIDTISSSLTMAETQGTKENPHIESTTGIAYTGDKLIGDVRIKLQTGNMMQQMAFTIIYIVLVIYTGIFALMYLKRVIYMAFFTMMAPLVALTYPLDKMRDGKAQAFDMWMKEYTFNALIQPFHLIIYYVLVGSAIDLAVENPLYALVAIGFMMPAEKLLRKFFGFGKSETAGSLGGVFGGAMLMQGINAIRKGGRGPGGKKLPGSSNEKESSNKQIRTSDSGHNVDSLIDGLSDGEQKVNGSPKGVDSKQEDNPAYNQARERFDEVVAEGFEEGDSEYDKAKAELDKYKGALTDEKKPEDNNVDTTNIEDNAETEESLDIEPEQTQQDIDRPHYLKGFAHTAGTYLWKGVKGGAKLYAKGVGAATLGTIGVAAGLASDDYSNVFKYGAAGAAAGGILAGKVGQALPSTAYRVKQTAANVRDEFERNTYSPDDIKKINNKRADDAFLKDKQAKQTYINEYGKDKYEEYMKNALEYRKYGITDDALIIKAMNLKDNKRLGNATDRRRIAAAKLSTQVGGMKDVSAIEERLRDRGVSEEKAKAQIDAIRKLKGFG